MIQKFFRNDDLYTEKTSKLLEILEFSILFEIGHTVCMFRKTMVVLFNKDL